MRRPYRRSFRLRTVIVRRIISYLIRKIVFGCIVSAGRRFCAEIIAEIRFTGIYSARQIVEIGLRIHLKKIRSIHLPLGRSRMCIARHGIIGEIRVCSIGRLRAYTFLSVFKDTRLTFCIRTESGIGNIRKTRSAVHGHRTVKRILNIVRMLLIKVRFCTLRHRRLNKRRIQT